MEKSAQIKTAAELRAVFNRASKNTSTCHNVKELQGLNSCGAFRKPPISEANWGTGFSIKTLEQWKKVQIHPAPESWGIRERREADEVPPACIVPTGPAWGAGGGGSDPGLLQAIRSRFSNNLGPKDEVS